MITSQNKRICESIKSKMHHLEISTNLTPTTIIRHCELILNPLYNQNALIILTVFWPRLHLHARSNNQKCSIVKMILSSRGRFNTELWSLFWPTQIINWVSALKINRNCKRPTAAVWEILKRWRLLKSHDATSTWIQSYKPSHVTLWVSWLTLTLTIRSGKIHDNYRSLSRLSKCRVLHN